MDQVNADIKEMKEGIESIKLGAEGHNKADDVRFGENKEQNIEILEKIDELFEMQRIAHEKQQTFYTKAEPMIEWFNDMNVIKESRIKLLKATGLWTGVIIGVTTVFGIIVAGIKWLLTH